MATSRRQGSKIQVRVRTIIINLLKEVNDGINPLNVQSKNQDIDNLYKSIYIYLEKENIKSLYDFLTLTNLKEISKYILINDN